MKSFRTELEDPIVEKDILELEKKIFLFKSGQLNENTFRSLRLARGVYGQRQQGVQMVRIKIPFGKISANQIRKIADISNEYSNGNLHITTRQDIQIHYVSLDCTPELWKKLEENKITLREACGNTIRNITASIFSGIDPNEAFDSSIYAQELFKYFLRNPICQDMGRKFKIAFASSEKDDAFTFIHDLGFIPKIKNKKRGFKVMIGGGIGSQPHHAYLLYNFLEEEKLIPFSESVVRVFDRYGERNNRNKARMKFLIKKIGITKFLSLIEKEKEALPYLKYKISTQEISYKKSKIFIKNIPKKLESSFSLWKETNVFYQKQKNYVSVGIKLKNGDLFSKKAHLLADIIELYTGDDTRLTINQSILLRFVPIKNLEVLYLSLYDLDLHNIGFHRINDIVACPGTDTCNLGIASSMGLSKELNKLIDLEFSDLIKEENLSIKISGCMNGCGQHTIANIGFQGMTIKIKDQIAPASQILLGGGNMGNGKGRFADKLLKVPSKKTPDVLKWILQDFKFHKKIKESFNQYYDRKGKEYFYKNLKKYSNNKKIKDSDFIDWGNDFKYKKEIGIGECAGVVIDLVETLFFEADEKLNNSKLCLEHKQFSDSIYNSYSAQIQSAKALLISKEIMCNSQSNIIETFDQNFSNLFGKEVSFSSLIYKINKNKPTNIFAIEYYNQAKNIIDKLKNLKK